MASNTLTRVINTILVKGLRVLRDRTVMPALVSREHGGTLGPAVKGQTIQIPIYQDQTVNNVTASSTPLSPSNTTPSYANITLSSWKETNFQLTDKEMGEVMDGNDFVMGMTDKSVNALARQVNGDLLALIDDAPSAGVPGGVYNAVGTAGTTPFSANADAINDAAALLNNWNAPLEDRCCVLDYAAAANLKNLTELSDVSARGGNVTKLTGQIGHLFGVDFFEDGQVPTHSGSSDTTATYHADTSSNLLVLNASTDTSAAFTVGDIITISGNFQSFMVASAAAISSNTSGGVYVVPTTTGYIDTGISSGAATTTGGTQKMNCLFQKGAFAFANRPLGGAVRDFGLGDQVMMQELTDPVSGLTLRLEVLRQTKQWLFQFDMLYGVALVRPELACRIMG